MPEDNPSTESVAENSHIEELLTWKIECFNHIRWLENTDWKSMTLIGTITFAIIGFLVQYVAEPGSYSSDLAIMILGLVIAFNMIGVAIILRNRRGFLENLYQASVVEHALGKKTDQFEFIMSLRPKNWDLSENPAFKNIINFGSVFSYLVIVILGLVIAFNMIGVAIILRNRRGFLENLYQASVVEHILGKKTDQFRFYRSYIDFHYLCLCFLLSV